MMTGPGIGMKKVLVTCLMVVATVVYFNCRPVAAEQVNEAKVKSTRGYNHLRSKAVNKGSVKIIVQVRTPLPLESRLMEKNVQEKSDIILSTQNQMITQLENKGQTPSRVRKFKYSPHIALTVDSTTLDALLSSPDVISIEEDIPVPHALDQSVPRIGATQLHINNVTGSDWAVAVLDTGVDKTHPFLLDSVVSEACYSSNDGGSSSLCPGGVNFLETEGSAMPYGGDCPTKECDHGTHVAGIVAGRRDVIDSRGPGVAPKASIIAIQVFSRFDSEEWCGTGQSPCTLSWSSDQIAGLERVYELRNTHMIASVNMSLGGETTYTEYCDKEFSAMKAAIDNLRAAGIATVIASGNSNACGGISFPACISSAVSVGATYVDIYDTEGVASYSNSSSFLSLLAPGSDIYSSVPWSLFDRWSGTSMATPHVAGAWALMKQAYPTATVDHILSSFTTTGLSVTDQYCSSVTKKRINVYEAYEIMGNTVFLTVTTSGGGKGTVTSPSGIDCGIVCSKEFDYGTEVKLTAQPDSDHVFTGWSGACAGTNPECIITMNEDHVVNAAFEKLLSVNEGSAGTELTINGTGFGTRKGKVLVGGMAAKIARGGWSDTRINCTIAKPPLPAEVAYPVAVVANKVSRHLEGTFTVRNPVLDDLLVSSGRFPDVITVTGMFFGTKKGKVHLEGPGGKKKNLKVTSWEMIPSTGVSTLMFKVPKPSKSFPAGYSYALKVAGKIGTATANTDFVLEEPLP